MFITIDYILIILRFRAIVYLLLAFLGTTAQATNVNPLEIGFEYSELSQNEFRNLGPSNYTFFVGKNFQSNLLQNWAWRLSFINVELSNEHLRDEDKVCCIKGDRRYLVGKLRQHRLYLDYLPYALNWHSANRTLNFKLLYSVGLGYNYWYTKDTAANEDHDVSAVTLGGLFRMQLAFFDRFIFEPSMDLGYLVSKSDKINKKVGGATLDRPENFTFSLLIYLGYRHNF